MGDARRNPRSRQFRLSSTDSADPICEAAVGCDVVPSEAWKAANPSKEGEPDVALVPPEDVEVVVYVMGRYTEPSHLAPQEKWARGVAPVATLVRMPYLTFRSLIQKANPEQPWRTAPTPAELDS